MLMTMMETTVIVMMKRTMVLTVMMKKKVISVITKMRPNLMAVMMAMVHGDNNDEM